MFLDTVEDMASQNAEMTASSDTIDDKEIDRMVDAETEAEHQKEIERLSGLRAELESLKSEGEKKKE